jgi:SAM-dependent methyltransferase
MDTSNEKYSGVNNLEVLVEAKNYNNFLKSQVLLNSQGAKTALDFGAGIGTFSIALKDMGLQVISVEPDQDLLKRLKMLGLEAHSSLDDIAPGSIDYIYSLNVLEHIEDDLQTLKKLCTRLRPGGRFFLYVPAFNVLYSSMDRKVGHFRRYKKSPLVALVQDAGFRIESAIYVDCLGFFASLVFKLIGNKEGDLDRGMVKLYDVLVFPLSRILDRVLGGLFGKNLMISSYRT